jgi:threonine/homoserine/homoserine lactone efflux protein
MEISAWVSIASICAVGAMSPGPSLAVVIKNTISGGRVQGVLTGVGHAIGVGLYACFAVFGMAVLLQQFPNAMRAIEVLGGLYLLWLGYQAYRHAGKRSPNTIEDGQQQNGFIDGFAISGLNPKIAVFFLALLGPLIPVEASNLNRLGVAALAMFIDGSWYVLFAIVLAGTGAAEWLSNQGKWVDRLLSFLLISVGLWLMTK